MSGILHLEMAYRLVGFDSNVTRIVSVEDQEWSVQVYESLHFALGIIFQACQFFTKMY